MNWVLIAVIVVGVIAFLIIMKKLIRTKRWIFRRTKTETKGDKVTHEESYLVEGHPNREFPDIERAREYSRGLR